MKQLNYFKLVKGSLMEKIEAGRVINGKFVSFTV